jgi:hypothetical protein
LANLRIYVIALGEIVRLDWLPKVVARLQMAPISILSFFGGIEPQISTLKELGFRIRMCFSVEIDATARATAAALHPEVMHCSETNVLNITYDMLPDNIIWDAVFGAPPFQGEDTTLMESMQDLIYSASIEHDMHSFIECIVPHSKQTDIRCDWEQIIGSTAQQHNAIRSGSAANRDRLYWTDTDLSKLRTITHRCQDVCCDQGWYPETRPIRELMARGVYAANPVRMVCATSGEIRFASADERDRMNPGLAAGSSGSGTQDMRNVGNGNAFSADVLWHVQREWPTAVHQSPTTSLMTADDLYAVATNAPDKLEYFWMTIDTADTKGDRSAAILNYMRDFARKYGKVHDNGNLVMPELDLIVNATETIPSQVQHPCDVPAHLAASAEYAIALMQQDGTHEKVEYKPSYWICMLFFQPKGRTVVAEFDGVLFKKGDVLQAVRPLKDMRVPNNATSNCVPVQWADWSPDRSTAHESIPPGTTHFKKHDSSNAYHSVVLTGRTADLSVCRARLARKIEILLRCLCGSQGQAAMGTFYPAWSAYGNCFFTGRAWLIWWIEHIDDVLCHATDAERCLLRFEIMYCVKQMMGLPATLKYDNINSLPNPKEEHVGFLWTPKGHCIGDKSVEFLSKMLAVQPTGGVLAMRLRGSLNQCLTAFDWSKEEIHFILRIMKPINDAITDWQSTKRFTWGTEQQDAVSTLLARLLNQPRVYVHPDWTCSETRCLVAQGDWDPAGVSWHLFSVEVADAADVTPEMLLDPSKCVLLCLHTKFFNSNQKKWHTFEGEMFAHVHGLRKCAKYLNTCLAAFVALTGPAKFAWGSDSTVTIFRLPKLTLPETKMDYLSAKTQRFIGWSDEFAMTRFWPSCRLHTPGVLNCLADACVRIVAQLKAAYPDCVEQDAEDIDCSDVCAMPLAIHTYAAPHTKQPVSMPRVIGMPVALPEGTAAYTMLFSAEQWAMIEESYSFDAHEYCGVKLSELHAALYNQPTGLNSLTGNRIKQWKDRIFYPIQIAGDTADNCDWHVIYTPSSTTRAIDCGPTFYPDLVIVVPDKCRARLSNVSVQDFPWSNMQKDCEYADWYLREDMIWIAHNTVGAAHAPLGATIATVKEQGWWPGLEDKCRAHIDACAICLPLFISRKSVNLGQHSDVRFKVLQIDDYILSPTIQRATGFYSILTMTEIATGATVYALRTTKTAREMCILIYTRWVPHYGTPEILSSDLDPALIGQVAQFLCGQLGIADRINTILGLKCPGAEHMNKYLSEAIHTAEAKGCLTNAEGLIIAVGNAQIKRTLIVKTDGASVFKRLHGIESNTPKALLSANRMSIDEITAAIAKAKPEDKAFMRAIEHSCAELLQMSIIEKDKRSRYNACNDMAKQANLHRTDFGFAAGMEVAVNDKTFTILDIPVVGDNVPIVAMLWDPRASKQIPVLLSKLRPLATDRQEITLADTLPDKAHDASIGCLIFYEGTDIDAGLLAGTVIDIDGTTLTVQINQPVLNANTWLPRWEDPNRLHKLIRRKTCPKGCVRFTDTLDASNIVCKGAFSGPGYILTDATIYVLKAMGYDTIVKDKDMATAQQAAMCMTYVHSEFGNTTWEYCE